MEDNTTPTSQPSADDRAEYIRKVEAGEVKPSPEELKGFLPKQSITGGSFTGRRAVQAQEAAKERVQEKLDESKGPITRFAQATGLVDPPLSEQARVNQAGIKAAEDLQATDLENATAALLGVVKTDPMFFRGMKIHRKIASGEKVFELKDGLLTAKGKEDLADYDYFYNHPDRGITFGHGASQMFMQLGADVGDTIEHLVGDATPVINPEYKNSPNYPQIESEARNFIMLAVQNRISIDELNSGKVDEDRLIKFSSLTSQDIREARKTRQAILSTFRDYTNPPEKDIDGTKIKAKPIFLPATTWQSTKNKAAGAFEAGVRVLKGWGDLMLDSSKDPLSVHGTSEDAAVLSGLMTAAGPAAPGAPFGGHPGSYPGGQNPLPPEERERFLRIAADKRNITAARLNKAANDIAHLNKWASGEIMVMGDRGVVPGPNPDPLVWSPGQTWADPLMIYGMGSGIFRALRTASRAQAAMAARYAALQVAAAPERFSLELANVSRLFSGMGGMLEDVGRQYAATIGADASKMTADEFVNLGLRHLVDKPFEAFKLISVSPAFVDEFLNSIPKPEKIAMTAEEWQLLPGVEKLKNLEVPAAFAGVENGADIWSKMNPQQRMKILIAERATEIHKLARERQAAAIAEATRTGTEAVQATAEANGNASVARRTAGAATSAFGEWVMGGRTLGNGFWRDISFAGLFNGTANVIDTALDKLGGAFGTTGKETAEYIKDMFRTRTVFKTGFALAAVAGVNTIGKDEESIFVKYPRYVVNTVFFMAGMRTLGYTAKNIGDFMRVWGDEVARGDPTLYGSYAAKIAKNPDSYMGIDKDLVFGPAGIAKFMSLGPEAVLRLNKRMLWDFGVKGGGVAEAIVYSKDRESLGQGFAIGTAFSGLGYSLVMSAQAGLGKNKLNAMRSDSLWRMLSIADGDPSNVLNFIDAHNKALKGGYEKEFLGAFLGIDNSTNGKVRFINDEMASVMRFAYDSGLKEQSESIRRSISLGYKTPEDIIGQTIRTQVIQTEVAAVTNKLNGEAATLETNIAANKDVAKQLAEKLRDQRLSTEERTDLGIQKMALQEKIKQDANRLAQIKKSLKTGDPIEFLKNNGVDIDTVNARVRAGVNKQTGNKILTFRGLTIETTKDGPVVYINTDKMNTQALWHEAAEAVFIAGGVDSVLNSAVGTLWGRVANDPQAIKDNRAIYDEAVKNGEDTNTVEFIERLKKPQGGILNQQFMEVMSQMLDAHMKSAGLDETWKLNALAGIREYYMTGNMVGIEAITREILANHTGLYLEGKSPLTLYNNGSIGMTLDALSDRIFNYFSRDTGLQLEAGNQLLTRAYEFVNAGETANNIRHFFVDPATGKRVVMPAFDRIAREVIRRANARGIDSNGNTFLDLRKMKPNERKIWAASNNVDHWLDPEGNLRDPKEITQIEAEMTSQSLIDLDTFRDGNPTQVRSTKKVTKDKKGVSTTSIDGVFSPQEIMTLLQNPGLPANIKNTLLAYAKAMYRPDGKIGLIQGIYSGESKEVVYTPNSDPKLREWGSPLLTPEHRALLPQSLSIGYETAPDGTVSAVKVRVNGLDWKAIEQRVIIAAGSDLARNHGLSMSDLYGLMDAYAKNLNKGIGNTDPKNNAIPSAKLFDPDGKNPQKGADLRDLMHFIFDFQKKKNDAYINQPQDWGELGLRGPTHPYTSFRADRWVDAQSGDSGQFIRVNEAAYRLSQGNFMGDESGLPKRKLNRKDVSETTPEKEAAAIEKATAGAPDVPAPTEKGKFINVDEPLPPNVDDLFGRINDIYAYDGEVVPKLVTKWLEETTGLENMKGESIIVNSKNIAEYVDRVISYIEREAKNSQNKNAQDRAQYVLPKFKELAAKIYRHRKTKQGIEDAETAEVRDLDDQARQAQNTAREAAVADPIIPKADPLAGVDTTTTREVSKKLAAANEDIQMWRGNYDDGDLPVAPGVDPMMREFSISERPMYLKEMKKALDKAFALKPDFNPGFDIYKYLPDYTKPEVDAAVQAKLKAEAEQVRAAQEAATPTAGANTKLVGELKGSMQDTLSAIRVLRKDGEKNMPMDIEDAFNRSSMVGKGIERLFDVLEGKKGTIDYEYSAGVAQKYIEGIDALIVANDKKLLAASKKKDQADIDMRSKYKLQLMDLKKTLEGVYEYTSGIAETAPAKQKPTPAVAQVSLEARQEYKNGAVISNKNAPWVEGIPSKVEKPLGEAVLKLAEMVINIEGQGLDARQMAFYYGKFKAAKDAGVTAEQFWSMYELDNAESKKVIGAINDYAKKKDGSPLFEYVAKKDRPNLLAPEDVARAAIERDKPKEAKPKETKPAPTAEAAPAPAAEPAKPAPTASKPKTSFDFEYEIGNIFNEHRILSTPTQDRYGQVPKLTKNNFASAANDLVKQLQDNGITPEQARSIFTGYEVWKTAAKGWDKEGLSTLYNWITSDIQGGAKPKPKTAQEIPPELAPTTEPTTTGKPKWDAKKANKLSSDMVDTIEKWEDAYGDDGDTAAYEDKIYGIIDKLADMGMKRSEIEALLGDAETSEGTVGSALDDKFAGAEPETPKTGAGTGQPPPKKPKPTAQGAGDEDAPEPAPKPKPKPVIPKRDPVVIPDAPENKGATFEWEDVSDPKKDPYEIKKKFGPVVRKLIDDGFTERLNQFDVDIKKATEVILSNNPTTKDLENARMALKIILDDIRGYDGSDISDFGISHFDRSPAVRQRFFEIFDSELGSWFSKEQKKRIKDAYAEIDKAQKKLDVIHENRVIADFIAMTDATDITGSKPGQKGPSTEKVLATKQPWQMADDRDLLPLTNRINDFIVAERFIPVDTANKRPGTSGLIFIDTKQTTPKGDNALKTILNSLAVGNDYSFVGIGHQGFYDIKVINANGEVKNFRISSDGSRGIDPATLKKLYAQKYAEWQKAMKNRSPGDPMPSIKFDVQGSSYGANKDGVALMNIEISEFLKSGQESYTLGQQRESNRQQAAQRKKDRQDQAAVRDAQRAKELADAAEKRQLELGLYNRQPVDPNNPETAMEAVDKDKRIVSRRKDTLVEVHKGKGKDGEFFRVYYTGQEFGGPREVFKSASLEASLNLAQSFTPFEGYRTAILSLIDGYPIDKAGPWMDKDFKPTTDPKLAAPLSVIFEKYEKEFSSALSRIRASGTYGLVDAGNGEYIVVPKKPMRDKNGSLDTNNPIIKISRRLVLKAMNFATQAEAEKAARQRGNAALPMPRQQPGSPVPQPAPAFDVNSFISDRASLILQSSRSEGLKAKADSVTAITKILTNRDNYKLMFMKNGTIRVYGANNNLLAVTDDEDEAFGWLLK